MITYNSQKEYKMKLGKILLSLVAIFASTTMFLYALDLRTSTPVAFTDSYTLTINDSHPHPFRLNSVVMTFDTAQVANTFNVMFTRGVKDMGEIFADTGDYKTLTWVPEQGLNFTTGDVLVFSNNVSAAATLTYNYEI